MAEFWEQAFRARSLLWGEDPTASAVTAAEAFAQAGLRKILIPGFGYGRNARPFLDRGMEVVGIEISETAIALAQGLLGPGVTIHHGSVDKMPFDDEVYDGVYCHALVHLLEEKDRTQFLDDCWTQVRPGGLLVFTAITKAAPTYGTGHKLAKDRYRTKDGVDLFFYDRASIEAEFGPWGLNDAQITVDAPPGKPSTEFWTITCRRT
jgi:SAM-dependent methyltransferase